MENRCKLMREMSSAQFAAWDLHLYLDTHKCDEKALEMKEKYTECAKKLMEEYEKCFGPLVHTTESGKAWLADPWPWEFMECDC